MKLKKKHFKRLKEIAEKLNHELNYSGLLLSDLITDIESVQKDKTSMVETIQEKPITGTAAFLEACAKHQKDFYENVLNEGRTQVAASIDNSTEFNGGLRGVVEALAEPKIGDVGYFWTTGNDIMYGIIKEISSSEFKGESYIVYRISDSDGCEFYTNFSKTPPELK
jgi:hypothetical protein